MFTGVLIYTEVEAADKGARGERKAPTYFPVGRLFLLNCPN